jgi:protease-4
VRAKEEDIPVIVSMGNLAGSGGYFVAMDATKIVAQPGTITASIGVLGGKLLTREFWEKLGITWDDSQSSANADMWSPRHDYSEQGYARFQAGLDRVYEDFTEKVAAGRGLPLEDVLEIAKGRIWTGEDAKALGLIDELGGLDVALRVAREELGLAPDAPIRLRRFPRRRTQLEMWLTFAELRQDLPSTLMVRALSALQPHVRALQRLGLSREPGLLSIHEASPPVQ